MNKTLIYLLVFLLAVAVSFVTIKSHFSAQTIGLILFFLVFVPVLMRPEIGLIILIISMLLSPEIVVGLTSARAVAIRVEDILLLVVILAWFLKTSFTKDIANIFRTKLTAPFFLYILACLISTALALFSKGDIDLKQSFFSILKYIEYFVLFIMVRDSIKSVGQSKVFLAVFLVTAFIVAIYSNKYIQSELSAGTQFFRVAPPVETRGGGEAGTLGGYLVFMMAVSAGLLLHIKSTSVRIFLVGLEIIMFRAFLYTLSRGSYIALIPMIIALLCFSKKGKILIVAGVLVVGMLLVTFAPRMIKERVTTVVSMETDIKGQHGVLEASPAERWESWKMVLFDRFPKAPLFGYGVARFFIDGQIFLILCEVGLVGFVLWCWVLLRLFRSARSVLESEAVLRDDYSTGLSVGFLAGFAGLLGHAIGSNTFIIIIVMEPFWFIAAIVLSLPRLREAEESAITASGA